MILFFSEDGKSQNRHVFFQNLREDAGLPYHLVTGIDQDSLGQLWLATYNGVYRYNGYDFKPFQNNPKEATSLSSNLCQSILVSKNQNIWIGTSGSGLNILRPNQNYNTRISVAQLKNEKGKEATQINYLVEDAIGNIFVGSSAGLFKVSWKDEKSIIKSIAFPKYKNQLKIRSLLITQNDNLWVGTNKGLLCYNIAEEKWLEFKNTYFLIEGRISDLINGKLKSVWVGVRDKNGIYTVNPSSFEIEPYPHIADFSFTDRVHLAFDINNHLWVAAGRAGVYRHNLKTKQNDFFEGKDYEASPGNFSNFVRHPLVDHFGNVWFCGGGLHKWTNTGKVFTHYSHPFSNYQSTSCIYDDEDFMISGLWGNGLAVWKKASNEFYKLNEDNGLISDRIYKIEAFSKDNYLIAGQGGFQLLNVQEEKLEKIFHLPGTIFDIKKVDGKIYLGGSKGLWEWDGINQPIKNIDKINIRQFAIDSKENIWIASIRKGLGKYDKDTNKLNFFQYQPQSKSGIQSNRVEHLDIDKNDKIWIATAVGLESYDPSTDTWELHTTDEKIAGIRVNAVHVYQDSVVWISNNQGISQFNIKDKSWIHYNTSDGLLNTYFYERASFVNEEGRLFFGGRKGVVHFLPEELDLNLTPPILFFDEIKIENQIQYPIDTKLKELNLDWKDRFFEINFTGIHLTDPLSTSYQYRLLPQQKDWTTIQKQPLFFSEMNSGNYTLEIKAINNDGIATNNPLKLKINITPPFWKSWWFIGLVTLFLISFLYLMFLRYKRRFKREVEIERKMNELKSSALLAQMNPHFIFNTMSNIQHFIISGEEPKALKYLSTLSNLIRKVLYNSNKNYISLEEEIDILKSYVQLENLRAGQPIELQIITQEEFLFDAYMITPMILQPIIENAVIHGLRPSPKNEKLITVRINRQSEQTLLIEVEDNGIGRIASAKKKPKEYQSTGIQNIKDRLNIAGKQLKINTNFVIKDLYDSSNQPTGTLVQIIIPVKEI